MYRILYLTVTLLILFSCKEKREREAAHVQKVYNELYRPQFHFTPEANWMNDPNGLVYLDGEYHLFYQYYPDSTVWGPMHWGHSVSADMIHWKHLPIALYPDSLGMIFSGSAVIDEKNSSGLGTTENPPMIAVFTYHSAEMEKQGRNDFQTQGLAYSTDKGRTWSKYSHNPIVKNPGVRDFRDPKVFWHEESGKWILLLVAQDHAELYSSSDLRSWTKMSEFGKEYGAHGGVWECPDLFQLTEAGTDRKKWVMIININPGGPNGGSGTQYFIGDFDGKKFTPDSQKPKTLWIDYGPDNYAGVTWSNTGNRKIFIGWMSNWAYAQVVPTSPWRSANTIPRELSLITLNDSLYVKSAVVRELEQAEGEKKMFERLTVEDSLNVTRMTKFPVTTSIIRGSLTGGGFIFEFSNQRGQKINVGYDPARNVYFVDRKQSGRIDFAADFGKDSVAPRKLSGDTFPFTMVLDVSSIEIFFDNGATVMTSLFFPDDVFTDFKIFKQAGGVQVDSLEITRISPVW